MRTSPLGISLITEFEGVVLSAYRDIGGLPTIGYGHTLGVRMGMTITRAQAASFLASDLLSRELQVLHALRRDVLQNQFDAIMSFVFNLGIGSFCKSEVCSQTNEGKYPAAADAFLHWNKAKGVVVPGLTRRRTAERAMFLLDPAVASAAPIVLQESAASVTPAAAALPVVIDHEGGLLGWLGL